MITRRYCTRLEGAGAAHIFPSTEQKRVHEGDGWFVGCRRLVDTGHSGGDRPVCGHADQNTYHITSLSPPGISALTLSTRIWAPWTLKGVSPTLQSGRYTISGPRGHNVTFFLLDRFASSSYSSLQWRLRWNGCVRNGRWVSLSLGGAQNCCIIFYTPPGDAN